MRNPLHPLIAVLDRVQRRFARSRPGSVLILTVVLVVLLALLGTALLSTTRTDRYTATQNTANTQIDLLVEGVKNLAKSAIVNGLYGTNGGARQFRPPIESGTAPTAGPGVYANWDAQTVLDPSPPPPNTPPNPLPPPTDNWLSPRVPYANVDWTSGSPVLRWMGWINIGTWLAGSSFESPFDCNVNQVTGVQSSTTPNTERANYSWRVSGSGAGGTTIFTPGFLTLNGTNYPAWILPAPSGAPMSPAPYSPYRLYLAADADGDGIADSSFFRLPVGEIDGVTYYAAVRIIDNNSAINVNTAWSRGADFDFTGNQVQALGNAVDASTFASNLGWFRSHMGLREALYRNGVLDQRTAGTSADWTNGNLNREMGALDDYRFGYPSGSNGAALQPMMMDPSIAPNGTTTGAVRPDGQFLTQGDALEHQLARRPQNPGYDGTSASGTPGQFRACWLSDAAALAYHFTLLSNPTGPASNIESLFYDTGGGPDSLIRWAANYSGPGALPGFTIAGRTAYSPDQVSQWFDENFNWEGASASAFGGPILPGGNRLSTNAARAGNYRTLRPVLTTYNPVSNQIQQRSVTGLSGMTAYRSAPAKTSINNMAKGTDAADAARFGELWRAFWCVMADNLGSPFGPDTVNTESDIYRGMGFDPNASDAAAFAPQGAVHPQKMFRSSIRDPRTSAVKPGNPPLYFQSKTQVLLRSAIAATQAQQLLQDGKTSPSGPVTVTHQIQLSEGEATGTDPVYTVTLFGAQPQPFITEVFVSTQQQQSSDPNSAKNPQGYVAIELYNPYAVQITFDASYELAYIDRTATATYPLGNPVVIPCTLAGQKIDPDGYLVIDNFGVSPTNPNGAGFRPPVVQPIPGTVVSAPLDMAYNHELILRRKVGSAGTQADYIPLDSFDFTGLRPIAVGSTNVDEYHYARACGSANDNRWRCVYPGRYDATNTAGAGLRQQGVDWVAWDAALTTDPWAGGVQQIVPPRNNIGSCAQVTLGAANVISSWNWNNNNGAAFAIHLPDPTDPTNTSSFWPGPNPLAATGNHFPFGQFARNGDMLQVPFIGAYVIQDPTGGLIEMNSISMDAAFAEDTDTADDPKNTDTMTAGPNFALSREQIGRFAPLFDDTISRNDLKSDGTYDLTAGSANKWNYRWATRLFDYLTVQAPQDDYLPNVGPARATGVLGLAPQPVDNDGDGIANDGTAAGTGTSNSEDVQPVHGLININTAPWRVLAALPFLPPGNNRTFDPTQPIGKMWTFGADPVHAEDDTAKLAKAIVQWRDGDPISGGGNGPFTSIMDLYRVPAFADLQRLLIDRARAGNTNGPGPEQGVFTRPLTTAVPYETKYDFEEQYLLLNKVSNLITTRSDSFTVYVLVQGWRGIGTTSPQLVVQRRAAFIQDRSTISPVNSILPPATNVPND